MSHSTESRVPLPEVLFALLILGLITAVAIPSMVFPDDKRAATCEANLQLLNRKIEVYAAAHDGWTPASRDEFEKTLAADKDLPSGRAPRCPFGKTYVYDVATRRVTPHRH
jgi:type II secretory pathway pseudopilin PulG